VARQTILRMARASISFPRCCRFNFRRRVKSPAKNTEVWVVLPGKRLTSNGTKMLPFPCFDSSAQASDRDVVPQFGTKHLPSSFSDVIPGLVVRRKI
jgi:hypothetical protein